MCEEASRMEEVGVSLFPQKVNAPSWDDGDEGQEPLPPGLGSFLACLSLQGSPQL